MRQVIQARDLVAEINFTETKLPNPDQGGRVFGKGRRRDK